MRLVNFTEVKVGDRFKESCDGHWFFRMKSHVVDENGTDFSAGRRHDYFNEYSDVFVEN